MQMKVQGIIVVLVISILSLLMIVSKLRIPLHNMVALDFVRTFQRLKYSDLIFIEDTSNAGINSSLSAEQIDITFYNFMSKRHIICRKSKRFGNKLDGGWDACLAEPYSFKKPCLVYSFGINYDFSFDDAISKELGCTVRCFDPSMNKSDHQRSTNVWFYQFGLAEKDYKHGNGWSLRTLQSLLIRFQEKNKTLDYLKLDIEGSEWPSLKQIISSNSLSRVKQLGLEIHVNPATKDFLIYYEILRDLEMAGMRRWYFAMNYYNLRKTKNGFRSCCYEMAYINTNFIDGS